MTGSEQAPNASGEYFPTLEALHRVTETMQKNTGEASE